MQSGANLLRGCTRLNGRGLNLPKWNKLVPK